MQIEIRSLGVLTRTFALDRQTLKKQAQLLSVLQLALFLWRMSHAIYL